MSVEVVFDTEERIGAADVSSYLYYLKVLYSLLHHYRIEVEPYQEYSVEKEQIIEKEINKTLSRKPWTDFFRPSETELFDSNLSSEDLYIDRIKFESPLEIWFMGIGTILLVSFLITGGSVEVKTLPPSIKIKAPPLGEGLAKLRTAISNFLEQFPGSNKPKLRSQSGQENRGKQKGTT